MLIYVPSLSVLITNRSTRAAYHRYYVICGSLWNADDASSGGKVINLDTAASNLMRLIDIY